MEAIDKSVDRVIEIFTELSAIPRCSKNEAAARQWVQLWAESRGFACKTDKYGNMLISVPGKDCKSDAPTIIIQGHFDMVCEKSPDSDHDFTKDPIRLIREGDWIRAYKTTLGADNGIAIAYGMALAEKDDIPRPPLELLFTVEEEIGLNGAMEMGNDFFRGTVLLNIDSGEEGIFIIGCSGGKNIKLFLDFKKITPPPDCEAIAIAAGGFTGGHSGIDINKNRKNAIRVLAVIIASLMQQYPVYIADFSGGSASNAIPRDSMAIIVVPSAIKNEIKEKIDKEADTIYNAFRKIEPSLYIKSAFTSVPEYILNKADSEKIINILCAFPNGPISMSEDFENVVDTSCNMAMACFSGNKFEVLASVRSPHRLGIKEVETVIRAIASMASAEIWTGEGYPGWMPDPDSSLLKRCIKVYRETSGRVPEITAIHAGLECGVIGFKYPGLEMISFGPDIKGLHSPFEKINVASVERVWNFIFKLMRSFAREE